ncbi:hypothetical protein SAMN04487775_11234 [Treponema bryantii]|uniref:Major surface protein n=1 Tax=Treponema bryantii TaxID=163 RepID=A0A1I3N4Q1_9SPIR|nr:hypothetical protein [Treponema bryantii]SFJ04258.1 hypothetical protein SAMN04487775_11234 [Treponema bryantii]
MKKIVALGAAAALVGGLFAAEPASNPSVVEFTGNASVEWGVDLDAGQTGFKNSEDASFKMKLFDTGDKSTSGDGVWAELKIKVEEDDGVGPNGVSKGAFKGKNAVVDTAKLHFGDFYIGIRSGDTTTGTYKFDGAIRSADNDNAKWLSDVGPDGYTQGIVAGYGNNNFGIDVDFRSNPDGDNRYTSDYAIAAEAKLKDSNELVEGLFVDLGGSVNISKERWESVELADVANEAVKKSKYTFDLTEYGAPATATATVNKYNKIGYSFNAGYKLKIDDKNWLKPAVGLTGTYETAAGEWAYGGAKGDVSGTANSNKLVAGVMFGWGSADGNAGVYYLDGGPAEKACPGVSVVAKIPLAEKMAYSASMAGFSMSGSGTSYDKVKVLFTPAFCTKGELIEGLSVAAYSEMAILNGEEKSEGTDNKTTYAGAKDKNDTFALALAAGVKYDIKADDITVTPQVGIRFANTAYVDNEINGYDPLSKNKVFDGLGKQKKADSGERAALDVNADGFFNLKAGVNVSGLINNTSFYGVYESANLLNKTDYSVYKASYDAEKDAKFYNVKLGTFNVGCKISF